MWRVPGERIALDLGGPFVEVERLRSWSIQFEGLSLLGRFMAASRPQDEYLALNALYEYVVREAQPQWDIVDHLGAVPPTARGMARLPGGLARAIASLWLETFVPAEKAAPENAAPPSAVDALVPPGPVNLEIKRRLRRAKRKAA